MTSSLTSTLSLIHPRNSATAAARIVALAALSDGALCRAELTTLKRIGAHSQLGLSEDGLHAVISTLCADLLERGHGDMNAMHLDARVVGELMDGVDDPALRLKVLRLCIAVAEADGRIAGSASLVLSAAVAHWGLQRRMLDARNSSWNFHYN